jgi:hypothetical protein
MSHNHNLREIAKFLSGLVVGDFFCGLWFYSYHLLPVNFFGVIVTPSMVTPWMIFDVALFIILVHYGWHIGRTPTLSKPIFFRIVGTILGVVALAHLLRFFVSAEVVIVGWTVPLWLSWFGVIVAGYLSYMSFRLALEMKK